MASNPDLDAQAHAIATRLRARFAESATSDTWCLVCTPQGLELRQGGIDGEVRIGHDVDRHWRVSRRDPLGRAMGKDVEQVIDATAGLGGDTLLLARMGFSVIAVERSALIAVILEDKLIRAGLAINVVQADATAYLPTMTPAPSVVYLDPMFPPRRRSSALPRKALVTLAELVGPTEHGDGEALLDAALACASQRVVVKRLPESPDLGRAPSHSHRGKTVRYDVYLTHDSARSTEPL